MNFSQALIDRSESKCELCTSDDRLSAYVVPPKTGNTDDDQMVVCKTCLDQISDIDNLDPNHWRCLNDSIWNPNPAVQVMAYRLLTHLDKNDWASDLKNMMYMDDQTTEWAQQGLNQDAPLVHKDSNGHVLKAGDSVVLIKDLVVKGANFTAKRGTAVRRISLVQDNPNHIEGRVNDQHIVILTQYVKKS